MRGIHKLLIISLSISNTRETILNYTNIDSNRGIQSRGEYKRSPKKLIYHNKLKHYKALIALPIIMATRDNP